MPCLVVGALCAGTVGGTARLRQKWQRVPVPDRVLTTMIARGLPPSRVSSPDNLKTRGLGKGGDAQWRQLAFRRRDHAVNHWPEWRADQWQEHRCKNIVPARASFFGGRTQRRSAGTSESPMGCAPPRVPRAIVAAQR